MIDREKLAKILRNASWTAGSTIGRFAADRQYENARDQYFMKFADYLLDRLFIAEKGDAESRDQQKFQEGFRVGVGRSAECMAVVERAERYILIYDQLSYEFLRSAVLDLMSARDSETEK